MKSLLRKRLTDLASTVFSTGPGGLAAGIAAGVAAIAAALVVPAGVAAQGGPGETPVVVVEGVSDVALDRRLERLLDRNPLVLTADTSVAEGDTLRGPVLLLDATLILEGVVTGDLVIVDAGAFVRPGSEVQGDLVNMGGGLYRSELSRVRGTIIDLPTASYRVVREPSRIVIEASDSPSPLTLDGVMGLQVPTYDRVNGVTLVWGARYRLPLLGPVTPSVHGQVGWQTERGDPTYGVSAELRWLATALEAGYDLGWATNDDWIRDDLDNALNYLWDGDDFRDYHEAERVWAGVAREFGDEEKSWYGVARVRGQVEDATSLEAGEPWHLLSGDFRANPPVEEERTTSVIASFDAEWRGQETQFDGRVEYEAAREWLDGAYAFDRISVRGDWAMHAFSNHTLEIEFFVQQPLGSGMLPPQEWSFVGGSGTLQTAAFAEYYGDRVVFSETKYIVPFPKRVALPILGAPELELIHAAGMAWTEGEDSYLQQEVGARLKFFVLYIRYMIDPEDPNNDDLDLGLSLPFGGSYPWERR